MKDLKDYYVSNTKTNEAYGLLNITSSDARHWVINHLDLSLNWTIKNPNRQIY